MPCERTFLQAKASHVLRLGNSVKEVVTQVSDKRSMCSTYPDLLGNRVANVHSLIAEILIQVSEVRRDTQYNMHRHAISAVASIKSITIEGNVSRVNYGASDIVCDSLVSITP